MKKLKILETHLDIKPADIVLDLGCAQGILSYFLRKKGGELLLATPRTGRIFLLHKLRPFLGMKLDFYGHKREGYSLKDLNNKLDSAGFFPLKHKSFSRFFSEFLELLLNFLYIKLFRPKDPVGLRDGHIRPTTSTEFSSRKKAFRMYSYIYPFVWLFTRLDNLFFFQRGYGLMIWAKKN